MLARHLHFFVALAREKHFARAAQACNITQSTLSAAIRKLEEDLQVPLVVRSQRYLGLTVEGEHLLAWARQILIDYDSLREDLSGLRAGLRGVLRLGVVPAAMGAVGLLTVRFRQFHPEAGIEIRSLSSREIQRALDNFEIEAGLTYLENEPLERVRRVPLYREGYVLAMRADHPLAERDTVTWADAAGCTLCLLSEDMQNRRILDGLAASLDLRLMPAVTSNSFLGICAHLRQGGFASIVPHTFRHLFGGTDDLAMRDLVEPAYRQSVGLVLSERDPLPSMAAALFRIVLDADYDMTFVDLCEPA
ncbi:DNA-binding transcriptional regulator, LysR family [Methylobacterium sp. UNC378MF]|uniref:LysR family transcriptional regulator n=1 Tax=Methylobacterium sp. UNC378MF TaxID=1502748 RepID=UPI0008835408|nr:LysR family transcriptional regulator [Methylobacterium sp. UNC378MF]SDA28068.1 DNA-binding transcriptional regulator, LysR family [Methylobacterium sp. UNC378MF]